MLSKVNLLAAASVALLAAVSSPALALSASVGGVSASVGDTSASVGIGSTGTATATVGDGSDVASVALGTADTSTTVSVSTDSGNLATVDTDGNTSTADVNLGNLGDVLGNVDVTTPNDPSTPVATQVADTFGTLSIADQDALRIRCRNVLADPAGFTRNVVALCHLIATLH
jgi:hypothetical protein